MQTREIKQLQSEKKKMENLISSPFLLNEYFMFRQVILNLIYETIDVIWQKRKFHQINPERIGYEFFKNNNFWNICIPIKRSGQSVNINELKNLLLNPNITCFGLCIGIQNENTVSEFIYALGLFQINLNGYNFEFSREIKFIQICNTYHMNHSILLLCRKISSKGTAMIIQHYGFGRKWIHTSRDDERYRKLKNKSKTLILAGQRRFESEL